MNTPKLNPEIELPVPAQAVVQNETKEIVISETASIINMIERAARDPSVDIEKLKQLMEMRERIEAKAAEREFDLAMSAAQLEMRAVGADASNPQTKSRYASFFALDKVLRPIYGKHGFALSFDTADCATPENVRVVCHVTNGAYSRNYHIDMPADGKGAKGGDVMTKTHATGSAVSYGRRYLLLMIFNIAVGEDDDGNAAGNVPISEEQLDTLRKMVIEVGGKKFKALEKCLLKFLKVKDLVELPAVRYDMAVLAIESKRGKV